MEKFKKPNYLEKPQIRETSEYETTFSLQGLERGYANTLGVALRRTLLSSITSLAPFCVRIEGVEHEFQTIKDVVEDVPSLIMNLRKVRFTYDPSQVQDNEIIKVTLSSEAVGPVTARSLKAVNNPSVNVLDHNIYLATVQSEHALKLELYLRAGRGFMSFEENKPYIVKREPELAALTEIKKARFIAIDSNFSPIEKVSYTVSELNSSSSKLEEKLDFTIHTDGTVKAKDAIKNASEILMGMFQVIGAVEDMKLDIFEVEQPKVEEKEEDDLDISQMGLSVRSANALKRIRKTKLSQIKELTLNQLEQTKNLGKKSIQEIIDKLKEYGYELKEGDE
ncbi:DNA-directed RNA polymerase subunit alpha [Mycoplasmopsis verecunda]|uniref:DNA-directed RNA polymerase subunit alpha n=1 Tax=Mycoplasmopsis verecunda TaxID=171291 RepID=A0A1T4KVH0_9BACT|nr:DNA-directed RNA polymerase subunit alpha [Mycoplasmopsis verecunda]WPB54625.1 DNA-directed RNA polymerase subunit alpha [Mycoplasmopsis verecunda]SJZ46396.1 DNA-directed RNA polymerase subunit alpha [Mycoplasmopsis verecunda]